MDKNLIDSRFPPALNWPKSSFELSAEILKRVLPLRSIHAPDFIVAAIDAPMPHFDASAPGSYWPQVIERNRGKPFVPWSSAHAVLEYREANLSHWELSWWQEAMLQAMCARDAIATWLVHQAISRHGLRAAMEVVLHAAPLMHPLNCEAGVLCIRSALACCEPTMYEACRLHALTLLRTHVAACAWAAYMFATEREFFEIAAAVPSSANRERLLTCAMPVDDIRKFARAHKMSTSYLSLPQQLKAHGADAWPLVMDALDAATGNVPGPVVKNYQLKSLQEQLEPVLATFSAPEILPELLVRLDLKLAREWLERLQSAHADATIFTANRLYREKPSSVLLGWWMSLMQRHPDAAQRARAEMQGADANCFDQVIASGNVAEATLEQIPEALREILRNPPWLRKQRPAPLPELNVVLPDRPDTCNRELLETRAQEPFYEDQIWILHQIRSFLKRGISAGQAVLSAMGYQEPQRSALLNEQPCEIGEATYSAAVGFLFLLPPAQALVESRTDAVVETLFPVSAHRTGRAVFPHPALRVDSLHHCR